MGIERVSEKGKSIMQRTVEPRDFMRSNSERLDLDSTKAFLKGGMNDARSWNQWQAETYGTDEWEDCAKTDVQAGTSRGDQAGLSEDLENRLNNLMKSDKITKEDYKRFLNQCSNNEADQCVSYLKSKSSQAYSLLSSTFIHRKNAFVHYVNEKKKE